MKTGQRIWLPSIREKIVSKHNVYPDEAEEVFTSNPPVRYARKGRRRGEDVYFAMGKTGGGRLLIIFFVRKLSGEALVISARDMTAKERRLYEKAKS